MGWEARLNPRSTEGGTSSLDALNARVRRFCEFFATREEYENYLTGRDITDSERAYLERMLPPHLQAQGSV